MTLQELLDLSAPKKKVGISEERIQAVVPVMRQYISFWREYPDLFVDFLQTGGDPTRKKSLNFFFYQRVFMRATARHKYAYMVFPRAYSKSFLSILVMMCRCVLYPGAHMFVTSGGKQQTAGIIKEKVEEICTLVPAFKRELDLRRGASQESKDYVVYKFKNGSWFDNLAASEKTRGKRRHAGIVEECVGVDGDILSQVIIPTMNVSRRCMDGTVQKDEVLNQSQVYITTAGQKNSFAYDKLITLLVRMIIEPESTIILGGTWRIPVLAGLIPKDFVQQLKRDGTFNDAAFAREYESQWSGTVENAFFNGEFFDRNRIIQKPEYERSGRASSSAYYIISADIGRKGDDTAICVFKVTPQAQGQSIKSLVNIYTLSNTHFEEQAIFIKKLYYKYGAKRVVIDGNGAGIGLIDYMIKAQIDEFGDTYVSFGIENDEDGYYKKYKMPNTEDDAIYIIKANAAINTEAHINAQSQLQSGKIKFLIDERVAKQKLLGTQVGRNMTPEKRTEYLQPFTLTSILKEELSNLREENEGINIILKRSNKRIHKDKFSAMEYALYYIKQYEESKKKRKKFKASDWKFYSGVGY